MDNCLLVGARGGIGSALLGKLTVDAEVGRIHATHRIPVEKTNACQRLSWRTLDLECGDSIALNTQHWLDELPSLDCLICTAGILHDDELQPEKRLQQLHSSNLHRVFQINAVGPLTLLAGLEPLLKRARRPKVLVLSAQVGSIEDNQLGGWYSYRMSKAALNMGLKNVAIEAGRWRNDAVVMAVHPGTTHSPLSAPFTRNRKQPVRAAADTAEHLYDLIKRAGPEHHGGFFTAQGQRLPW